MSAGLYELNGNGVSLLAANRHLRDVMRARGRELEYVEYAGGHDPMQWRSALPDGLVRLLGGRPTPRARTGETAPPKTLTASAALPVREASLYRDVWLDGSAAVTAKRSRLAAPPAYEPDEAFWEAANALILAGRPRDAIPVLQLGLDLLPKDPTTHAALAEALTVTGDLDGARQSLARACALAPTDPTFRARLDSLR
jgi:tetratricopeptide (TPR) repeat protein